MITETTTERVSANLASQVPANAIRSQSPRLKQRIVIPAVLILLVAAGVLIWRAFVLKPRPESVIALSGRIEGDDSNLAAKVAGRVSLIRVREGDYVHAGDEIGRLDDSEVRAEVQQAEAAAAKAEEQVALEQREYSVLRAELNENQLLVGQSRTDTEGRVSEATAQLASAEAALARADATYRTLKFTADAYTELVKKDEISKQEATEAVSNAESQAALVSASKREVEAARGALVTAKATAANPAIHLAQTDVLRKQLAKQELQIQAAKSEAARARAELAEAEARLADLTVIAPFDGTVSSRLAEPGEVLSAGTPIVTLINLGGVYLRGFIPEGVAGRVRIGQPAHVYLDSAPAKPLDAIVIRIDPETSFTPENTYFRDDRVKQVIGLKLLIKNAAGFAKPGMPADGEILLQGTHWPKR